MAVNTCRPLPSSCQPASCRRQIPCRQRHCRCTATVHACHHKLTCSMQGLKEQKAPSGRRHRAAEGTACRQQCTCSAPHTQTLGHHKAMPQQIGTDRGSSAEILFRASSPARALPGSKTIKLQVYQAVATLDSTGEAMLTIQGRGRSKNSASACSCSSSGKPSSSTLRCCTVTKSPRPAVRGGDVQTCCSLETSRVIIATVKHCAGLPGLETISPMRLSSKHSVPLQWSPVSRFVSQGTSCALHPLTPNNRPSCGSCC